MPMFELAVCGNTRACSVACLMCQQRESTLRNVSEPHRDYIMFGVRSME